MRLTIFQLLVILLTVTVFLQTVHAVPSARQAWTDGFWQTLPDDTEEETSSAKESVSTPSLPLPASALQPCPRRHILYLDVFSWYAVTVITFITAICAFTRFHAWYQSPPQRRQRLARKQLRQCVHFAMLGAFWILTPVPDGTFGNAWILAFRAQQGTIATMAYDQVRRFLHYLAREMRKKRAQILQIPPFNGNSDLCFFKEIFHNWR